MGEALGVGEQQAAQGEGSMLIFAQDQRGVRAGLAFTF
jgi:hypothetical protein